MIPTSLEFRQYTRGWDLAGRVTQHDDPLTEEANPDAIVQAIDEALWTVPVATMNRRKGPSGRARYRPQLT